MVDDRNEKAAEILQMLSLLVHKISYASVPVIVIDNFPYLLEISRMAFKLTKLSIRDQIDNKEYKQFLSILSYIEKEHVELRYNLAYRILKLIFIMQLFRAVIYVSILAKLMLQQIALSLNIPV